MSDTDTIEITRGLLLEMLALAGEAKAFVPLHHDAADLAGKIKRAIERAGDPTSPAAICGELLEAIGTATGEHLPTTPSLHSLMRAREALAMIGRGNVVSLPSAVTRDARRDIAAEVSRQVEQIGGVDLMIMDADLKDYGTHRYPARPAVGERFGMPSGSIHVVDDVRVCPQYVVVVVRPAP